LLIVVITAAILPAFYFLLETSLFVSNPDGSVGAFTDRYFRQLIDGRGFLDNAINTVVYSLGSAAVAILLGAIQAWIAERTDTPLRRHLYLVSIISLGVPYVLLTIAWLLLLARRGPVNELYQTISGSDALLFNVNSLAGMILIEGLLWAPLAFLLLAAVFRNADASFEEAALMSGARMLTTFRLITLPLSFPGLLALALLIFIRAFESFEVPALVGMPGKVYVLTTDIYDHVHVRIPADYGTAASFGITLLVLVAMLLVFYGQLSRNAHKYRTVTGKGFRPRVIKLGPWRYVTAALLVLLVFFLLILPLAVILWAALLPFYQNFSAKALPLLTSANFVTVFQSSSFRDSIMNTLILGAGVASLVVVLGAPSGWLIARRRRGANILDLVGTSPLAFPSIVLGLAFLNLFLTLPFHLYGTLTSIVLAMTVALLPYGLRYSHVGAIQVHPELEEVAGISGAGRLNIFLKIMVPLIAPALVSCWLFVFLVTVRAVAAPLLLVGPDSQIVAVTLFAMWSDGQIVELAALGVVWTAIMSVLSTVFYFSTRRYGLPLE
jgi:iron(III) transport system permease protein